MKAWPIIALGAGALGIVAVLLPERAAEAELSSRSTPQLVQKADVSAAPPARPVQQALAQAPAAPASLYSIEKAVAEARARGAGEDEVYRIRAAGMPAQSIAMLAEREDAEKEWARRLQAWRQARAALAPGDADGVKRLREQMFNEQERALLATAERSEAPQLVLE